MDASSVPSTGESVDTAGTALVAFGEWAGQALGMVVVLALLARLLVYVIGYRGYTTTTAAPGRARVIGVVIVAGSSLVATWAFGARGVAGVPGAAGDPIGIAVFAVVVGALGALVLSIGFASSPVVDAKVLTSAGASNDAWAIDVLDQISSAHREGSPQSRVRARGNRADLGDAIQVADRSGNGVAALVAWLLQLFFNVAPWLVQVTILDGISATATLRRNGHMIEEVPLRLAVGTAEQDQHRKLLIMASSFAAMRIAAKYLDITGFYGVESWKSAAYASLAIQTTDEERTEYIELALAEDPANLVAEFEELLDALDEPTDAEKLWVLMSRLESMIVVASTLCGTPVGLDATPDQWHEKMLRRFVDRRRDDPRMTREPPQMMVRAIEWYLGAAGNWVALKTGADGEISSDVAEDELDRRRRNVASVISALADLLTRPEFRNRLGGEAARPEVERMQMRTALAELSIAPWAQPQHRPGVESALLRWFDEAVDTADPALRFLLACALAHEALRVDDDERAEIVEGVRNSVEFARFSAYYREWTFHDPELRLLGADPGLRNLALSGLTTAWEMKRFAEVATTHAAQALGDPGWIDADVIAELRETGEIGAPMLRWIADGAAILRAARRADSGFDETAVLRAVRFLLDDAGFELISLRIAGEHEREALVDRIAEAVYWVPDASERATASRFVDALLEGIASVGSDRGVSAAP